MGWDGPGMGWDGPGCARMPLLPTQEREHGPGKTSDGRDAMCPIRAVLSQPVFLLHYSLPGCERSKRRKTRSPNLRKRQEGAQKLLLFRLFFRLFFGSRPREVREQVVKHLMIYLRNEPPQLEIPGDLHTPRAESLPCTHPRINPLFGRSLAPPAMYRPVGHTQTHLFSGFLSFPFTC